MVKIINKLLLTTCWICQGKGCKVCNNTGKWKDNINYIIYEKNGKKFAIDSDNIG